MGFMDLLKSAPEPQQINQDGKQYQFTPGQNGSLIAKPKDPVPPAPTSFADAPKKEDSQKAKTITASVRG